MPCGNGHVLAHRRQGSSAGRSEAHRAQERRQRREHQAAAVQGELVVAPVQREVHLPPHTSTVGRDSTSGA